MLQAIVAYAEREGVITPPGFKAKSVRWLLIFDRSGRFLGIHDYADGNPRDRGREFPLCPDLNDSELKSVLNGRRRRHFLLDSLSVVIRFTAKEAVDDDTSAKHEYYLEMLDAASPADPTIPCLANALRDESTRNAIHSQLLERKARPTDSATLAVADGNGALTILVESTVWHEWWRDFRADLASRLNSKKSSKRKAKNSTDDVTDKFCCLLSGQPIEPAKSQPVVNGLQDVGGIQSGDRLVAFDKEAFRSYGLDSAANAAMSEESAQAYAAALTDLIKRRSHRLAGVKVVHWYSGRVSPDDDILRELHEGFGLPGVTVEENEDSPPAEEAKPNALREQFQAESCAHRLLRAIESPERPAVASYHYYAMALAANRGRVVVRGWMEGQFDDLVKAVNAWYDDLEIVSLSGDTAAKLPRFESVITSLLRERLRSQKYQDWVKPVGALREALWHCAVGGRRLSLPEPVTRRVLLRHRESVVGEEFAACLDRSEESFAARRSRLYCRMGLLKAFLVRSNPGDSAMLTYLDEDLDKPCYQFGRLVAVLADLQREALRRESGATVKASIVDRFYPAASTTPRLVHARLVSLSNYHLRKLEQQGDKGKRAANAIRDRIADISMRIDPLRLPPLTPLEDQSFFALGYYQQIAKMNRDRRETVARKNQNGHDEWPEDAENDSES